MSDELVQNEAPLKEKVLSNDRMSDYMGMVTTPSNQEKATIKAIQEVSNPIIPQRTKPSLTSEASQEELESRSSLIEDYVDVGSGGVVSEHSPTVEVIRHESDNTVTQDYIEQLAEAQMAEAQEETPSDMEALRPKTLTANRMAQYVGFMDNQDPNDLVEQFDDFIEESEEPKRRPIPRLIEGQDTFNPPKTQLQDVQFKVGGDYEKYEFESYIGTEFNMYLKQQYGSRKAALLDKMFIKQYDVLEDLEGSEIEEKYYDMVDTINTDYDRNSKLQNFKNTVKFFTKFYHYLKFKEDELTNEEEDLFDVIKDIYQVLNRTVNL